MSYTCNRFWRTCTSNHRYCMLCSTLYLSYTDPSKPSSRPPQAPGPAKVADHHEAATYRRGSQARRRIKADAMRCISPKYVHDATRLCPTQERLNATATSGPCRHCSPDTGGKATASRSQGGLPVPDPRTRPSMRKLMYNPFSGFLLAVFICV